MRLEMSYDESRFARLQSRRGHLSGETQKHLKILQLWDVTLVLVVHLFTLCLSLKKVDSQRANV